MKDKIKLKIFFYIFVSLLLFSTNVFAENDISISLEVSKNEVLIDENINLSIKIVTKGLNGAVGLSSVQINGLERLTVHSNSSSNSVNIINGMSQSLSQIDIEASSVDEGIFVLGPAVVSYKDPNTGQENTIKSNTVTLNVSKPVYKILENIDSENNEVVEKGRKTTGSIFETLISIVVMIFVVVLGLFLFWYQKNKNEFILEDTKKPVKIVFPDVDSQNFVDEIYNITKDYINKNTNIDISDMTTMEIIEKLKKSKYYKSEIVKEILNECDLRRYAKKNDSNSNLLKIVKKLII